MLTKFLRYLLRAGEVGLAVTVASVLFGPTNNTPARSLLKAPVSKDADETRTPSAIQPSSPVTTSTPTLMSPSALPVKNIPIAQPKPQGSAPLKTNVPDPTHTAEPTHVPTTSTGPSSTPGSTPTDSAPGSPEPTHSSGTGSTPSSKPPVAKPTGPVASVLRAAKIAAVLSFARAQLGEPYVFAGAGNGWDCSGLTLMAFRAVGVNIGTHSATNQYVTAQARGLLHPYSTVQKGDLLFYTAGGTSIEHVTIYAGNGMMIEAAHPGTNVREVPVRSQYRLANVARFIP